MASIDWMWVAENPKEAAAEIERLRAALEELANANYESNTLAGGIKYMAAHANAVRVLNQRSTPCTWCGVVHEGMCARLISGGQSD